MKKPKNREEAARLKAEAKIIGDRTKAMNILVDENEMSDRQRRSFRTIGALFGHSHEWVADLAERCLDKVTLVKEVDGKKTRFTRYTKKKGFKELIKPNKRGRKKGTYSQKRIDDTEKILATKDEYPEFGAVKIGIMAGSDLSGPTVHAVLREHGHENVTMRLGKVYKRFEMDYVNEMWQIDYVELGMDIKSGRKVESFSVIDDKSRYVFATEARTSAKLEDVLEFLEYIIKIYGKPRVILSDHGTQWAANNGGDARFDEWCEIQGIRHAMGKVRKPTTQGKVERFHGSLRREAHLPEKATLEEYRRIMDEYVLFYNMKRPHWSCDLKTPAEAYTTGLQVLENLAVA